MDDSDRFRIYLNTQNIILNYVCIVRFFIMRDEGIILLYLGNNYINGVLN